MATREDPPTFKFTSNREEIGLIGVGPVITAVGGVEAGATLLATDVVYLAVTLPLTVLVINQLEASRRKALVAQLRGADVVGLMSASMHSNLAASGLPTDPDDVAEVVIAGYGFTMSEMGQACVMMAAKVVRRRHGAQLPEATVAIGAPFEPGDSGGVFCSSPRRLLAADTARLALEDAARTLDALVARYLQAPRPTP